MENEGKKKGSLGGRGPDLLFYSYFPFPEATMGKRRKKRNTFIKKENKIRKLKRAPEISTLAFYTEK